MGAEGTGPRVRAALERAFEAAEADTQAEAGSHDGGDGDGDGEAVVEWMVHPGLRTPEGLVPAEAGCGGAEADDFARSSQREDEMRALAPGGALREWVVKVLGARLVA
jgi:hypothetical protein